MLKCVSRFSGIIAAGMLAACMASSGKIKIVSPEAYASRSCWIDRDGDLSSYLVLAQEEGSVTPYLISSNCIAADGYTSDGEGILHNLNAVRMTDAHGQLQRRMSNVTVLGNTGPDLPQPSSPNKVFYLKARSVQIAHPSMTLYAPVNIKKLIDMNVNFERFLELTRKERERLLQAYGRGL
jgi:hypothetical protein